MPAYPFFVAVVVVLVAAPAVAVEPVVVYIAADTGHFWAGLATAQLEAPDDGDPVPPSGIGAVNARHYEVQPDQCHRALWFSLRYDPDHVGAGFGGNSAGLGYAFRVEVRNDALGFLAAVDVAAPGDAFFLGTVPAAGAYRVDVWMRSGLDVDWTFTLRGLDVLRFAPHQWEPACASVRINEVEANPLGTDAGNEWIELHNEEFTAVDVSGWKLAALHGEPTSRNLPPGSLIAAEGFLVIPLTGSQFLDNTDEEVALTNAWGIESDRTILLSDEANDGRTQQRMHGQDGTPVWVFATGTPGGAN